MAINGRSLFQHSNAKASKNIPFLIYIFVPKVKVRKRLGECCRSFSIDVQYILHKSNDKYKKHHDQHWVPHKFQVGDKVWLNLHKERLIGPHQKLHPLCYGLYTITKDVGDNAFELNIPPFLGMHRVFNVALLRSYFPPLLDTSNVAE